jgi:hypothetical protein
MSSPHPLNQAVIAQALHDLRNGQLRRCKAMGFGDSELDALKHPALVSVLLNRPCRGAPSPSTGMSCAAC